MFYVDSANLEENTQKNKTFSQIWCSSIANETVSWTGLGRRKTCFGRSSLIRLSKPWSQTAWRSSACELAGPSGTDRRLQNSELGTACPPLQEARQDTTVKTQSVFNCHSENWLKRIWNSAYFAAFLSSSCYGGWRCSHPPPSSPSSSGSPPWTPWRSAPPRNMALSGSPSASSACNPLTCAEIQEWDWQRRNHVSVTATTDRRMTWQTARLVWLEAERVTCGPEATEVSKKETQREVDWDL